VPNTIDMALQPSREARAIIKAEPPFALMHVNDPWAAQSGVTRAHAEGGALCDALRLHPSQEEQLYALAADCSIGRASSAILMTRSLTNPSQPALIYFKVHTTTTTTTTTTTNNHMPVPRVIPRHSCPRLSSTTSLLTSLHVPPAPFVPILLTALPCPVLQLFPLTGNSDSITHFVGVMVDLPLTAAESEALMAHCGGSFPTHAAGAGGGAAAGYSSAPGSSAGSGAVSAGRNQGEQLFRQHRQQYQMRQERVSDAQLQQAYYLLSAIAPGSAPMPGPGQGQGMAAGAPAPSSSSSSSHSVL
jgi:hypothetical protein